LAGNSSDILIRFDTVSRRFGPMVAVDGLTLDIRNNEFFALLGPSGCGKTTLLRMLAGFETPDEGRVLLGGADITAVPPHKRPVNMMFQSYALFPHLTVEGNIAFGLKQEGLPKDEIAARVAEMLALTRLEGLGARRPDQLSGGQRQRVALARSLVKRPRVLLLDEPLGALDKKLRAETQFELMALQRKLGTTFVIVTHDQDEAMILADRIAVMNRGALAQVGAPAEIYEHPESRWVAEFVGDVSLIEGRVTAGGTVETANGAFAGAGDAKAGDKVWLALRPEKIRMAPARPADGNAVSATVLDAGYLGDSTLYQARLADGTVMKVSAPNTGRAGAAFRSGDAVWLSWPADAAVLLRQ
jgi:putrescine transport system ATP-binding protein